MSQDSCLELSKSSKHPNMFVKLAVVALLAVATSAVEFRIKNNEIGDVWIGIQGNDGREALNNGGFVLGAGEQVR